MPQNQKTADRHHDKVVSFRVTADVRQKLDEHMWTHRVHITDLLRALVDRELQDQTVTRELSPLQI
jgi:hypothetical protein